MAENAFVPELDMLLIEWVASNPIVCDGMRLEKMRDSRWSEGNCATVAMRFEDFLRSKNFPVNPYSGINTPSEWGYDDREIVGLENHDATTVTIDDETFMIDWTASQYGYIEFPMIQVQTEDGWERG